MWCVQGGIEGGGGGVVEWWGLGGGGLVGVGANGGSRGGWCGGV